jgi:hypothetical protein
MSILDLGNGPTTRSSSGKSKKAILGLGLLVAVLGIGSTLASTISINANQSIEFGQGVQQSVYCGSGERQSITVTPASAFSNSETGTFGLSAIEISNIPEECSDMNFVIKVYDSSSPDPKRLAYNNPNGMGLANVWWASGCPEAEPNCRLNQSLDAVADGYALISSSSAFAAPTTGLASVRADSSSTFTVEFLNGRLPSNDVRKIVIETQEDTFGFEACEASGDCTDN